MNYAPTAEERWHTHDLLAVGLTRMFSGADQQDKHPHAPAGTPQGGQFTKKQAQPTTPAKKAKAPPAKHQPAHHAAAQKTKPSAPAKKAPKRASLSGHFPVMRADHNNNPGQVAALQHLLTALKLGNVNPDGTYGPATEDAVRAAQVKLGMSPTGHASATFVHKLQAAMALSPCLGKSTREAALMGETRTDEYRRTVPTMCVRGYDFTSTATKGDGRTLEGIVAVYNTRARIRAQGGDFDEEILPGAFARSIAKRTPVMQWEHGLDPRVGRVPIAAIQDIDDDSRRLRVRAHLFDNPVVEPIRQAIAAGAVKGMSFRFEVPNGGDTWSRRHGDVDLRRIADMDAAEIGPVVFPAYDSTTVSVRSLLAHFDEDERAALVRELAAEVRLAVDLNDLTGRPDTRSAGGGDAPEQDPQDGDDEELEDELEEDEDLDEYEPAAEPAQTSRQRLDEGALRVRGILR